MYQDARYIIQYYRGSVTRAKNAIQEDKNIIRMHGILSGKLYGNG